MRQSPRKHTRTHQLQVFGRNNVCARSSSSRQSEGVALPQNFLVLPQHSDSDGPQVVRCQLQQRRSINFRRTQTRDARVLLKKKKKKKKKKQKKTKKKKKKKKKTKKKKKKQKTNKHHRILLTGSCSVLEAHRHTSSTDQSCRSFGGASIIFCLSSCVCVCNMLPSGVVSKKTFEGKRAIVTGAGQGIGRAIVKMLIEHGCRVVAISKTASLLSSLRDETGCETLVADLADEKATIVAANKALEAGDVHMLVCNAGVNVLEPFLEAKVGVFVFVFFFFFFFFFFFSCL
jgi:hypothetical protein